MKDSNEAFYDKLTTPCIPRGYEQLLTSRLSRRPVEPQHLAAEFLRDRIKIAILSDFHIGHTHEFVKFGG